MIADRPSGSSESTSTVNTFCIVGGSDGKRRSAGSWARPAATSEAVSTAVGDRAFAIESSASATAYGEQRPVRSPRVATHKRTMRRMTTNDTTVVSGGSTQTPVFPEGPEHTPPFP
jgi:hypothetical protein